MAAVVLAGLVGCHSSSRSTPAPAITQYEYSASSNDRLVVVPQPSRVVDLAKPAVGTAKSLDAARVRQGTGTFRVEGKLADYPTTFYRRDLLIYCRSLGKKGL